MRTFDVSFKEEMPCKEIAAENEDEAKNIYLEAVKRALNINQIDAIELEIIN